MTRLLACAVPAIEARRSVIVRVHNETMASASRASRNVVFAVSGRTSVLELPRPDALALLDWLGLGRPEFGAIEVNVLLPLCRRRLWPERRNLGPLKRHVGTLATAIAASRDAVVHFG